VEHLIFTQKLPITLEKAWSFFSNPYNLREITPPQMNFQIQHTLPEKVYEGMFIGYKVSPLAGIPMEWVTEITHVKEPYFFIDEQRKGPYEIWHHEHHFEEIENGILMTDKLYYSLPFGFLGRAVNRLVVRNKVLDIFGYRKKVLENLFRKIERVDNEG
jgi:ligand-binding SRPBCC domain-containing protein